MIVTNYKVSKLHVEMTKTGMKMVDLHMVLCAMLEMQFGCWKSKREHLEEFEAMFICLQHTSLPIPVKLIGIYVAPKCKYTQLIHELDELMRNSDDTCDTIFVGDFNMKSVTGMHHGYNRKLEYHMKNRFNFNQVIQEDT